MCVHLQSYPKPELTQLTLGGPVSPNVILAFLVTFGMYCASLKGDGKAVMHGEINSYHDFLTCIIYLPGVCHLSPEAREENFLRWPHIIACCCTGLLRTLASTTMLTRPENLSSSTKLAIQECESFLVSHLFLSLCAKTLLPVSSFFFPLSLEIAVSLCIRLFITFVSTDQIKNFQSISKMTKQMTSRNATFWKGTIPA